MRALSLVGALGVCVGLSARATPARAQTPGNTPAIWYRASAECPSAPEFLGKIADSTRRARLAEAGDHIDFVVTLLAANGETVGRLERQTNNGTVAIRELRDATCGRVADALALSLGLALEPASVEATSAPAPDAASPESSAASVAPAVTAPPAPESAITPAAPAAPSIAPAPSPAPTVPALHPSDAPRHPAPTFGVDAGVLTGAGTQTMARGSAFVDVAHVARDLSLRFAVVGAAGSSPTPFGSVGRWLLAGRAELCPWHWGGERVWLAPCAALELGVTSASIAATSDRALWAAPALGLRVSLALAPSFRVEAGAGMLLPLARAHVFYGAQPLYQDEIVAFQAALGFSFGQP